MATLEALPGLDSLGCGYDATEYYANPESSRFRIFDLGENDTEIVAPNGRSYSRPRNLKFELGDLTKGSFHCVKGQSAEEYRSSLTTRAGISASYGLFSIDVKSTYKKEQMASFNRDFVSVHHRFDAWVLSLPNYRTLRMLEQAEKDINSDLAPADVVRDYGTHVLVRAVIGGRAEYNCLVNKSRYTSSVEVTEAAKAAYTGALSISASYEKETKDAAEQFKSSSSYDFETVGGSFNADFNPESFRSWMNTFSAHPVLVDFAGNNSLVPIYMLAKTGARRAELEAAYNTYIQNSQKIVPDNVPALEVRIIPASTVQQVGSDSGSGAKQDLALYRPILEKGGEWRWVGQSGNNNQNLIIVKALVPGAIAEPKNFSQAWTDSGSRKNSGYSLWNVVAPPGYRALGGLARFGVGKSDYNAPSGGDIEGLVCIHESLCTEGKIAHQIWNDHGTRASANGSVWAIGANGNGGLGAGTFYSQGNHNTPGEKVYVITRGNRVKVRE